ncbi:MAG TPA: hypothetical protein VF914_02785 [Chloroflexia bacterium]|jgi:hypothetical protein
MSVHLPHKRINEPGAGPHGLEFGRAVANADLYGGWFYYWYYDVPTSSCHAR